MMKNRWLIIFILILFACREKAGNHSKLLLKPLSPYSYEFKSAADSFQKETNRIEYYFLSGNLSDFKILGEQLTILINQQKKKSAIYPIKSLYIYKETNILNSGFKGNRDKLNGIHDDDLIAYLRWTNGKQDIFYLLKNGNVVYDALTKEKIQAPFEFD